MRSLHLAVFLFGLSGVLGRYLALPPITIVFGRTAFAAVTLALILSVRGPSLRSNARQLVRFMMLGALLAAHWYTFFYSIEISSVAIGLLAFSTFPLFVTFLEPMMFRERLTPADVAAACVVCIGVAIIVPEPSLGNAAVRGLLWGTISAFLFAVLSLLNRAFVAEESPLKVAMYLNLFAALTTAIFVPRTGGSWELREIALLAVLGVLCTALAHAAFLNALRTVRAQTASVVAALEPVYGIALAAVLLGEHPASRELVGGAVIVLTSIVVSLRSSAAA